VRCHAVAVVLVSALLPPHPIRSVAPGGDVSLHRLPSASSVGPDGSWRAAPATRRRNQMPDEIRLREQAYEAIRSGKLPSHPADHM